MNLIYSSLIIIRVLTSLQALLDASLVLTSGQPKYSQHKGWDCNKSSQRKSSPGGRVLLSLGRQTPAWAKSTAAGGSWRTRGRLGHGEVGGLSGLSTFNQRKHGQSWDYRCPSPSCASLHQQAQQHRGHSSPLGAKGAELRARVPTADSTFCKSAIFSPEPPPLRAFPCAPLPKAPDVHAVTLMSCWKAAGAPAGLWRLQPSFLLSQRHLPLRAGESHVRGGQG